MSALSVGGRGQFALALAALKLGQNPPREATDIPISTLPPISESNALFLDFDGTLADIAPHPDAVHLAPGLIAALAALQTRLGGALAIVSGRPLDALDRFLEPWRPVAAAEHGGLLRLADGTQCSPPPPDLSAIHAAADALADAHPGLFVERKTATLALHYRSAPQLERLCKQTLSGLIDGDASLELLEGKFVVEVKPAGTNKGLAISMLMKKPPFSGRRPLFVGDDVTDEAGFRSAQALGGAGIKVGAGESVALHRCESPQSVRAWLDAALGSDGTIGIAIR